MGPTKLRILLCVLFLVIVALVSLAISYRITPTIPAIDATSSLPHEPVAIGSPLSPPAEPSPTINDSSFVGRLTLIIPVAGVRPEQLIDTFDDARSEGRLHDAIDIAAPLGTPVLAAANGRILKLFQSDRGGTTIYQLSADQELVFYYAHLSGYAPGLVEGNEVRQGEVIAYVGDTGNAGLGNFHLHFSIAAVSDPKRYWEGTNINPYPLLHP
uniref:PepM n=1 Tax=uncultured soil bacterium TaxID=164851 RepID=L0MLH7_9BACT|nr:PepM [uncultured soil bacterium]